MKTSGYVFVQYPEDWRGRTVEVWDDGCVGLDSGLVSHERKSRGEQPVRTMLIGSSTTGSEIEKWLSE